MYWGAENFPNSHHYVLELKLEGHELDQHGYLVDIVDVEKHLDEIATNAQCVHNEFSAIEFQILTVRNTGRPFSLLTSMAKSNVSILEQ